MNIEDLMQEDDDARQEAVAGLSAASEGARSALVGPLREAAEAGAAALVEADEEGEDTDEPAAQVDRALEALAHLGLPAAEEALLAVAAHDASLVRTQIVTALFSVRTAAAQATLLALVEDDDSDVRGEVAAAIQGHPWAGAARSLTALAVRGPLTQPLAEALAASAALAATDVQAEAAEVLLGQAKGSAAPHHLYALDALVRSGGALPGVAAAAPAFAKSEDARIRIAGLALQAAADVERSASLVTLIDLAAKGSTDDAAAAGVELRALPAPIAAAGLDDAMRATDPTVRARAAGLAMATVFLAREAKLTSLLEAARDADERVREAAVAALGRCLPAGKPFFRNRAEQIAPTLAALGGDTSKAVLAALGNTRKVLGLG